MQVLENVPQNTRCIHVHAKFESFCVQAKLKIQSLAVVMHKGSEVFRTEWLHCWKVPQHSTWSVVINLILWSSGLSVKRNAVERKKTTDGVWLRGTDSDSPALQLLHLTRNALKSKLCPLYPTSGNIVAKYNGMLGGSRCTIFIKENSKQWITALGIYIYI